MHIYTRIRTHIIRKYRIVGISAHPLPFIRCFTPFQTEPSQYFFSGLNLIRFSSLARACHFTLRPFIWSNFRSANLLGLYIVDVTMMDEVKIVWKRAVVAYSVWYLGKYLHWWKRRTLSTLSADRIWPGHIHNTSLECHRRIKALAETVRRDRNMRTFRRYLLPPTSDETCSLLLYAYRGCW